MNRQLCFVFAVMVMLVSPAADAAKRKLPDNLDTPEGALLKHLMDEPDAAKKTALMEEFAAKHAAHESALWVLGELQTAYLKGNQFTKALAAGEKVLTADGDDVVIANGNLKAAEGLKDAALIRKWAIAASAAARRTLASPQPPGDEEAAWKTNATYARQVDAYCDYALYSLAIQANNAADKIELSELLIKHSPASQYITPLRPQLFVAYQQAGKHTRALAMAEEEIRASRASDDMVLYAATKAYERQDKAKVTAYAKQLVETLPAKQAPQGVAEPDWARSKNLKLGVSHWMLGVLASNEQRWADADVHLRTALPLISHSRDTQAETLFHLGLANYKLGDAKANKTRILDALKFNSQCAAIPGPFQAQAKKNVAAIRSQYHIQ